MKKKLSWLILIVLIFCGVIFKFAEYNVMYSVKLSEDDILDYIRESYIKLQQEEFTPEKVLSFKQISSSKYYAFLHIAENNQLVLELFERGLNNKIRKFDSVSTYDVHHFYIKNTPYIIVFGMNPEQKIKIVSIDFTESNFNVKLEVHQDDFFLVSHNIPNDVREKGRKVTLLDQYNEEFEYNHP